MAAQLPAFATSMPAQYDTRLGPMCFEPYARDLARRLPADAERVLETAAGTGVVSRHLLSRLGPAAALVVTDPHPGMLDIARQKIRGDERVACRQADGTALPFDDNSFDAVVCQFGLTRDADPAAGLREARRVLTPDGTLLFSTWAPLADNPIARIAHEEIARAVPHGPPPFVPVLFGRHDVHVITDAAHAAGFTYVRADVVEFTGESQSAHHAAMGLVCGSPLRAQLRDRGVEDLRPIVEAIGARLARAGGFAPMRLPMKAYVFTAQ